MINAFNDKVVMFAMALLMAFGAYFLLPDKARHTLHPTVDIRMSSIGCMVAMAIFTVRRTCTMGPAPTGLITIICVTASMIGTKS